MKAPESADFPILSTQQLVLRELTEADIKEIFFLRSDERVLKYLDRNPAQSIQEALEWLRLIVNGQENQESFTWGICLKNSPQLIGTICFWNIQIENSRAEIGYTLHPDLQNKGIMNEAMGVVLDFGFKTLQLHSVEANVNPSNEASIRLLQKNNFVKEANFKENYYFDGKYLDTAIYSLLASVHLK